MIRRTYALSARSLLLRTLRIGFRMLGGRGIHHCAVALALAGAPVGLSAGQAQEPTSRPVTSRAPAGRFEDRYAGLLANNPFKRDRRSQRAEGATTRPIEREAAPPPSPQREWMLTGIVFEDGRFRAYLENRSTGESQRVDSGHLVAGGAVTEVFIDALGYELDGHVRWIELGQDLTGAFPEGIVPPPATPSTGDPTVRAAPADGGALSIEERMRQRRAAETRRP